MNFDFFLRSSGIKYAIRRDGTEERFETGLINHEQSTRRAYIGFKPGTDIKIGDILINPANDIFHVCEVKTDFFKGNPHQLKAYYQTEAEFQRASNVVDGTVFNIQNAYGSIIGNNNNAVVNYDATIKELKEQVAHCESADKEDLEKIVSLLEMIVNNQIPPQKGLLSRFSAVMERNSWITGSAASAILSWMMSQTL